MSVALLPAQGGVDWTQRFPANSPPARSWHAMAHDQLRERVVLFGGIRVPAPRASGSVVGDTWEWDGSSWTELRPATSPEARCAHAMAYDPVRQRVVMFGGGTLLSEVGDAVSSFGDTWEWDGTNWTQRRPATSPPPRYDHGMVYDEDRGRILLFGGFQGGNTWVTPLSDTWEWDGTTWTQRFPATSPPVASRASRLAYDIARSRAVLSDGFSTWEWDGASWTLRNPVHRPSRRSGHGLVYDAARARVVMFGGQLWNRPSVMNDTWEWDGVDWTLRLPPARFTMDSKALSPLVYDRARGQVVLFSGGSPGLAPVPDTWVYAPVAPATYSPFGTGCPGSAGIPILAAAPFSLPWIDDTFTVDVGSFAAGSVVFLVTGLSNTSWQGQPLPLSLASLGMPGCNALVSVDAVAFASASGSTVSFGLPICDCPALIGARFHNQALVLDPGGPIVSNAATGIVGGR